MASSVWTARGPAMASAPRETATSGGAGAATPRAIAAAVRIVSAHSSLARMSSGPSPTEPKLAPPFAASVSRDAWSSACSVLVRRCCSSSVSGGPVTSDRNICALRRASAASCTDTASLPRRTGAERPASATSTEPHTVKSTRAIVRRTASTATIGVASAEGSRHRVSGEPRSGRMRSTSRVNRWTSGSRTTTPTTLYAV